MAALLAPRQGHRSPRTNYIFSHRLRLCFVVGTLRTRVLLTALLLALCASQAAALPWSAVVTPRSLPRSFLAIHESGTWHPLDVPNPYTNPGACNIAQPGYLCDPDGILTQTSRKQVLDVLSVIRQNTSVECPGGSTHAYQAAAVLIRSMDKADFVHGSIAESAEKFARAIGDHWGVGNAGCDNGIIMFLSIDDRYGYIATGKTSMKVLTDSMATQVIDNMKPLLRDKQYGKAMLQGVLQIYNVLQGKGMPAAKKDDSVGFFVFFVVLVALVASIFFAPRVLMCCCFMGASLAMPFAKMADRIQQRRQQDLDEAEQQQAQRELASVQAELERNEFDQAVCPICLEPLEQSVDGQGTQALECRHRYHAQCIDPWVRQHGSCPLCRADATIPLPEGEAGKPDSYQRRLRGYLSTMRARHPRIFDHNASTSTSGVVYHTDPVTGYWVFYPMNTTDYSSTHMAGGLAAAVDAQYNSVMSQAQSWESSAANSSSGGGGGFGGGGFSGGGGGGGGW